MQEKYKHLPKYVHLSYFSPPQRHKKSCCENFSNSIYSVSKASAPSKKLCHKGILPRVLDMVKNAIRNNVPFEYLWVDSWFTCTELVDFAYRRHKKFHLLVKITPKTENLGRKRK